MTTWANFGVYTWEGFTLAPSKISNGTIFLQKCIFSKNTSPLTFRKVNITFSSCQFHGNGDNGAVVTFNSSVQIENCIFANNTFITDGSGPGCMPTNELYNGTLDTGSGYPIILDTDRTCGGAAIAAFFSDISISGSQFTDNYVSHDILSSEDLAMGGAVMVQGTASTTIDGCFFQGNYALPTGQTYGDSVYIWAVEGTIVVKNSEILGSNCSLSGFGFSNIEIVGSTEVDAFISNISSSNLCSTGLAVLGINQVQVNDSTFEDLQSPVMCAIFSDTKSLFVNNIYVRNVSTSWGIMNYGKYGYITESRFYNNEVGFDQQIILNAIVENCEFIGNYGDGCCVYDKALRVSSTLFEGNSLVTYFPDHPTDAIFDNCTFVNNSRIGVFKPEVIWNNSRVQIYNSLFESNANDSLIGGALFLDTLEVWIENSTFSRNNGSMGGALAFSNSNATIINCNFFENVAYGDGGAIYFDSHSSDTTQMLYIAGGNFSKNFAQAADSMGGSIYSSAVNFSVKIVSSEFSFSSANNGGALGFAYAVVPLARSVVIENCTLVDNYAAISGGAIYASDFINFTISQSVFSRNTCGQQGGAIYMDTSTVQLQNSLLANCSAGYDGGAIYIATTGNTGNGEFEFTNVTFQHNNVSFGAGGALAISILGAAGPILLNGCSFENNSAFSFGGAIYSAAYSQPTIENSTFSFNKASQGGALYANSQSRPNFKLVNFTKNSATSDGGAVSFVGVSNPSLVSVIFSSNYAGLGGAVSMLAQANASFESCTFFENVASLSGGAVYSLTTINQSPLFYKCNFISNTAPNGGAFAAMSSSALFVQSTLTSNSANSSGGGVHLSGRSGPQFNQVEMSGNTAIISGGGIYCEGNSSVLLNSSVIDNNFATQGGALNGQQSCETRSLGTQFMNNIALDSGGAIFTQGKFFYFMATSFTNNMAKNGGGIYLSSGMDPMSTFLDCSFALNAAKNGGGALFWDLEADLSNQMQQYVPQCTMCTYDQNSASYGQDSATKIVHIEFKNPPPVEIFAGVAGPYEINVVDFYAQPVSGVEPTQIQVVISSAENGSIPILTGVTETSLANGTAIFPQLEIEGELDHHYLLTFSLSGSSLGGVTNLEVNVTFSGCGIGQELVSTTNYEVCQLCARGFYNLNGNGSCLFCPPNAICNGGSDIRANDDYYLLDESGVASTYSCPNGMCKNGTCTAHRSGVLCGACDPGYQSSSTGSCIECKKSHYADALFGDVVLLWLFVAVLQLSSALPKRFPRHDRHAISGLTNIILFFLQTISLVGNPRETLGRLFSFFNFGFFFAFSHHCALKVDFFGDFLLSIFMPMILLGILLVNLVLQFVVHTFAKCCNHDRLSAYTKVDMTTYTRTICSLVLFSYSHVTQAVFTFVNCRTVGPYRVVASSPYISCDSTRYKHWSIFAYILFSYVVLLPIVLLIILVKMYKNQQMSFSYFAEKFGIIFQCFKTKSYYWQVVILVRRLLFIMIYVVAFSAPFAQSLALCIFAILVLIMHLFVQPFYFEIDNLIEASLLTLLAIVAGSHSAMANGTSPSQISTFSAVVTILAVVPIAISLYCQFQYILIRWGLIRKRIGYKEDVPMKRLESSKSTDALQPTTN